MFDKRIINDRAPTQACRYSIQHLHCLQSQQWQIMCMCTEEDVVVHCVSKKGTPTLSIVTLKRINRFGLILAQISLTQLAIKRYFKFPPHPTSVSTLPGENRTNEILHFIQGSIITLLK